MSFRNVGSDSNNRIFTKLYVRDMLYVVLVLCSTQSLHHLEAETFPLKVQTANIPLPCIGCCEIQTYMAV